MREKYPNRLWLFDTVIAEDNPEANPLNKNHTVTYLAEAGDESTGGIIGREAGDTYYASRFMVDPAYQNRGVAQKLLEAASKDFSRVKIIASSFGKKKGLRLRRNRVVKMHWFVTTSD